jgi:hypothetical protein
VARSCEHGNKPSGSIKGEEFLDKLNDLSHSQESVPKPLLHTFRITQLCLKL